jgi:hypothetical protein
MAKKNDNTKYALLALLFGVGGYFIYKKLKDSDGGDKPEGGATEEDVILAVEQAKQAQSGRSFSAYQIQIMQLQAWLQVGIDGDAGKQTLSKLDYYWANYGKVLDIEKAKAENYPELRKNGYGLLSPNNISQYIAKLNAGTSPRQNYWKSKGATTTTTTASNTDTARIAAARPIVTAFNSGTSKLLKFTKEANLKQYTRNSSGAFVAKSSFFGFNTLSKRAGSTYKFESLSVSTTGFILAKAQPISGDAFYVYISPYAVTNA